MKELFASADQIFGLLDITEGRKNYIRRKLHSAVQLGFVYSPDQVYSFITDWLDRLNIPWAERFAQRLDSPINGTEYNGKPLYYQNTVTKETPFDLLVRKESMSFGEVLHTLDTSMSTTYTRMLELFFGNRALDIDSGLTENQVRQNSSQIMSRLEEVTAQLYKHRIVVPRIDLVQFNQGLKIVYKGKFPSDKVQAILDSHGEKISAYRVGQRYGVATSTVLSIWRDAELEPHFGRYGPPISEEQQFKVFEGHSKGWGSCRTSRYASVSQPTVLSYWHKRKLKVREQYVTHRITKDVKTCNLTEEQIADIVLSHPKYGGNVSAASKDLPYCHTTIRKYWAEAGLPLCVRGQKRVT